MISLRTLASAGTTWRFHSGVGAIQDHPRIGGDQVFTLSELRPDREPLPHEPLEGVIAT